MSRTRRQSLFILEDDERRQDAMRRAMHGREIVLLDNAPAAIAWLSDHLAQVAIVSLDHDLGATRDEGGSTFDPGTGRDVADYLATRPPACPVILATTNSLARPGMQMVLEDAGWSCASVIPWGDLDWIESDWASLVDRLLSK